MKKTILMLALAAVAVSGLRADFDAAEAEKAFALVTTTSYIERSAAWKELADKAIAQQAFAVKLYMNGTLGFLAHAGFYPKDLFREIEGAASAVKKSIKSAAKNFTENPEEEIRAAIIAKSASRNALMRRIRGMVEWMKANPVLSAALLAGVAGVSGGVYGAYTGKADSYLPAEDGWKRNVARANPAHWGALVRDTIQDRWTKEELPFDVSASNSGAQGAEDDQ